MSALSVCSKYSSFFLSFYGKVPTQFFFLLFFAVHQEVWTSSITLWETSQMMKWCQFQTGKTPVWVRIHTQRAHQTHRAKGQVNTPLNDQSASVAGWNVSADIQKLQCNITGLHNEEWSSDFVAIKVTKRKGGVFRQFHIRCVSFSLLHFLVVFSKIQVSEVFDVPSVLVNRRQADPHAVQLTEVHSGDELWRDHQDAHQWACKGEKEVTNPGVTLSAHTLSLIFCGPLALSQWFITVGPQQPGDRCAVWCKVNKIKNFPFPAPNFSDFLKICDTSCFPASLHFISRLSLFTGICGL